MQKVAAATVVHIHYAPSPFVARALRFYAGRRPYYITGYPYAGLQVFGPDDGVKIVTETPQTVEIPVSIIDDAKALIRVRGAAERIRSFTESRQNLFRNPAPAAA